MKVQENMSYIVALSVGLLGLLAANQAIADGTETLGPPENLIVQEGSGYVAAGVGLAAQPGAIEVDVPAGAAVRQVLLYWAGEWRNPADDTITVGGNAVTGALIGGPTYFFYWESSVFASAFRADITDLGLVTAGPNTLVIEELTYDWGLDGGAGVLVIYDDGAAPADIQIVDGVDLAFFDFPEPRRDTIPQTFTFDPAEVDRTADLTIFAGSVEENRPTSITITVDGETTELVDALGSVDGPAWDTINVPVDIAAGSTQTTVQVNSTESYDPLGASIVWVGAAFSVSPETETCVECNGGVSDLTLRYLGSKTDAHVVVYKRHRPRPQNILFDGVVQPGETFVVSSGDVDTPLPKVIRLKVNCRRRGKFRTDCRKPIGPGVINGKFEVVEAVNIGGSLLCPIEQGNDFCDQGKPRVLTLRYTGDGCDASSGSGHLRGNRCSGDPEAADPVYIIATNKWHPAARKAKVWFEGWVNLGETFDIDAANAGRDRLGRKTWVFIFSDDSQARCGALQRVKIRTSCRRPILEGSRFGSLELVDYVAD